MCITIGVRKDGIMHLCDSLLELRKVVTTVVFDEGFPPELEYEDLCLCQVDAEATAAANHMSVREVPVDDPDFICDFIMKEPD